MPRYDFTTQRLFVEARLTPDAAIELTREQANYLVNVLRLTDGAGILLFNGADGEFSGRLIVKSKRSVAVVAETQTRQQHAGTDLHYLFAPLKHARLDYMVQKAVEMGASSLQPVITARTQAARVNVARMRANVVEAAEQCGILRVPEVAEPRSFDAVMAEWPADRRLIFCDEDAEVRDPIAALGPPPREAQPLALIIGPEGGFDPRERGRLLQLPQAVRLSLGPRILRADTAAVAALALVQAVLGDGR